MANDKFLSRSAVFVALFNNNGHILLHRRCNTGYMDGYYDMPSGHVERGEPLQQATSRELREETGIFVNPELFYLWHVNQFAANNHNYYNFFFTTDSWQGKPVIAEPEKCDDMRFFRLNNLPNMTAGSYIALKHYGQPKVTLDYIDQATFDAISKQV